MPIVMCVCIYIYIHHHLYIDFETSLKIVLAIKTLKWTKLSNQEAISYYDEKHRMSDS